MAIGAGTVAAQAQAIKIGVFDPARVSQETAEGSRIQARLNALQQAKRGELDALQEEIRVLEEQFINTAPSLAVEKRKELGLKIQRKRIELEGMQKSATQELQLEVEQAQGEWQARVLDEVQKLGRDEGFTLILQFDLVAYHADAIDVTDKLIARIDAGEGGSAGQ
jgi:Skp family chaperone for outer membrane proteins